jgi:hypothetical protein
MADEGLPPFEPNDLTQILLILLRIEAKLDELIEEDDGEEEDES